MVDAIVGLDNSRFEHLYIPGPDGEDSIFRLGSGCRVSDVWVDGGSGGPTSLFHIEGESWVSIRDVRANNVSGGAVVHAIDSTMISLSGIISQSCDNVLVLDECEQVTVTGWLSSGDGGLLTPPVHVDGSHAVSFVGCQFDAIDAELSGAGILIESSNRVSFDVSNQISNFAPGDNDRTAIQLEGSDRCTISPTVNGLTAGTAFTDVDFVRLVGSSDNLVSYGHYQPFGLNVDGNQPRHALLIDADSHCNIVVGNNFARPDRYTGNVIEDNGANTRLFFPADPTYGDNFTDCGSS